MYRCRNRRIHAQIPFDLWQKTCEEMVVVFSEKPTVPNFHKMCGMAKLASGGAEKPQHGPVFDACSPLETFCLKGKALTFRRVKTKNER